MQNTDKIKTENCMLYNKTLCQACLSPNRKLNVLGELCDIFRQICFHTALDMSSEIFLCWECRSLLTKIKHFQEKVAKAQSILNRYVDDKNPIKSLSNLLAIQPAVLDYDGTKAENEEEHKFEISFEVKKVEPPQEIQPIIKEENEIDFNNHFDDFDYEPIEEVKDEHLPDALKELSGLTVKKLKSNKPSNAPTKRTQRYKMTYRSIENGVRRVVINENDLDAWVEREKSSTYYRNLKSKCEKCFSTIGTDSLRDHYRKYHIKSEFTNFGCHICQQWYPSEADLTSHIEQHYNGYSCTVCGHEGYTKANMRSHMRQHNRIVQCLECPATFTNTRNFFLHYRALHRIFICDHCDKKVKSKGAIAKHINKHHSTHRCVECALTFANYRTYKEHINLKHRIERSEASYCVLCNIQFDNVKQFRRHIRTTVIHMRERNEEPKKTTVPCPACPNVYARKTNMMNHYRAVHSKQSKYYCTICKRGLLNRTRYKEHMMYVHEGCEKQRTKICYMCGRGFYNNRILSNHIRTHTGERPFECEQCDARFAQKAALDSHIKFIHMKNKRK